ncbi:MAG: hypothetical protein FWF28_01520 [Micrococcales bacterium]|nr:hypothetical protein [Micrococcales bacterium]
MPLKWQRQIGQEVILTSEAGKFIAVAQFAIHDRAGILRDRVLASVVINPDSGYSRGPSIQSDGRYFRITSSSGERRATWLTGTNWQDRHLFAFTWDQPDPLRIAQDATAMARAGIEVCRPHFFHPGWFNATAAEVYGSDDPALKDRFESGPPLSEKHLRAFEAHVALFNAFGIALSPSLFTNPPASMGNPAHWMGTSRLFVIDAYVAAQQEFAEQVMNRLATVPGCFWDLDNEPDTALHEAGPWVERHKRIWGRTGQSVGVGTLSIEDSVLLGESADWHSAHGSLRHGANIFISGKPALLQEAHNPAPTTEEGDDEQATHLSRAIAWTLRYGGAGILPWNWSQSHMNWRYGGGWIDYWDRELGTAVHADSTPRKGLATLTNWAALLRNLTFDQSADEVGFVYPRRFLAGRGSHEYLKLLASRGIPVRAFNDSEPANWNLRGLKLLIFPHAAIGNNKEALLAGRRFAELGGTVWAHNDTAKLDQWGRTHQSLFPIPAISTVEHLGAGRWIWKMGWNFDDHPADSSLPIDLVGFAALLDELHLSTRTSLALTDGTIDFDEHFLMGARSMSSDWASRAPIPDQNVVTRVLVTNNDGAVTRGWAFGQPLEADGLRLSSDGELFMLGRTISSIMIAATRDLVIESARPVGSVTRIQPDVRRRPSDEIIGPPVQALPEGSNRAIIQVGAELSQAWLRVQLD